MTRAMFSAIQLEASEMNRREFVALGGATAVLSSTAAAEGGKIAPTANPSQEQQSEKKGSYRSGLFPTTFVGGLNGVWNVQRVTPCIGDGLPSVKRLDVREGIVVSPTGLWTLHGVAGQARYVERREKGPLDAASPPLGRAEATKAALVPIRKSMQWWALPQDERRAIFEEHSHHIADSMKYLPRIARRLYHSRDLGEAFDFLTWFEFAPEHAQAFDDLLGMLRSREEWSFVDREVEIRLER
jgi:hypothetical protein